MPGTDVFSRLQSVGRYALELEAVSRHFGALVALADINMTVAAGERRAVLGSNGAGKTTLFNAITGDFPPTTGRIRLFGEDVTDLPVHERIRTYQISLLFNGDPITDIRVLQDKSRIVAIMKDGKFHKAPDTQAVGMRLTA